MSSIRDLADKHPELLNGDRKKNHRCGTTLNMRKRATEPEQVVLRPTASSGYICSATIFSGCYRPC